MTGAAATNSGTINLLAAQGTSTALGVTLNNSSAGAKTGTAQINLTSDGAGTSGLGTTGLTAQTVTLTGTAYNAAVLAGSQRRGHPDDDLLCAEHGERSALWSVCIHQLQQPDLQSRGILLGFERGRHDAGHERQHGICELQREQRARRHLTGTESFNYNNVTPTGGAVITGGSGATANIAITATVSGVSSSTPGQTYGAPVFQGTAYGTTTTSGTTVGTSSGYSLTSNFTPDPYGPTTATLIGGVASAPTTVNMSMSGSVNAGETDNAFRVSDVLTLSGIVQTGTAGNGPDHSTLTDNFVLEISVANPKAGVLYYIGWWDAGLGQWVNAIAGNSNATGTWYDGGQGPFGFCGSYAEWLATQSTTVQNNLALQLGAYGYDTEHRRGMGGARSQQRLYRHPEPGTWGMIVGGFGMLIAYQRMRRRRWT